MAANGTLYTYPENFRAFKALIAAQYSGAKVNVDNNFVFGETNKSDAFLKKFPLGKVPAFETTNGQCIFESNAISWAVANEQLRGKTPMDQAQIISWMNFADNEILPASCTWVFPCLGIMQFNKSNTERAKEDVKKALGALNLHLLPRTFLVGERITLADISVCCTLLHLYQYVLEPSFRKPFQNVNRWFTTLINQPQVKAIIGDLKLCEKMAQFDNKKFAEVQGKIKQGGGDKKEKKEVKKEAKKEQPKKEASPAAAPAPPKPKDPLDALPAGLGGCEAQLGDGVLGSSPTGSPPVPTVVPPIVEKVLLEHIKDVPDLVVYFDIETTGFDMDCDIVQLSATVGQQCFNEYLTPSREIFWKASEVTGLTYHSGSLWMKGRKLNSLDPKEALKKWLNWMRPLAPVLLVAHNCYSFDSKRLLTFALKHGLNLELSQLVMGFVDTLPMFKDLYPKMDNYRQQTLVGEILKETYNAHDALADVKSLQKLVMKHKLNDEQLKKYSFTYQSLVNYMEYSKVGKERASSLTPLVDSKHLSSGMADTIGKSGLRIENLRQACVEGSKVLENMLSEPGESGQPRVTRSKAVLNKIYDFFVKESTDGAKH